MATKKKTSRSKAAPKKARSTSISGPMRQVVAPDSPAQVRMPHLHDDGFGHFIVVEGNIGSGKSAFCNLLASHRKQTNKELNEVLLEPVDNPRFLKLLGRYYGTDSDWFHDQAEWDTYPIELKHKLAMSRWGFPLQVHALNERLGQHRLAVELVSQGTTVIQDRSIYADGCFGITVYEDGHMTREEWDIYSTLFGRMKRDLRYPDVMIYLRTDPDQCHERMVGRDREQEEGVPLAYLQKIHDRHELMVQEMARYTRVIRIDWNFLGRDMGKISRFIDQVLREDRVFLKDMRRL